MSLAIKIMECFDTEIGEALCSGCSRWTIFRGSRDELGVPLEPDEEACGLGLDHPAEPQCLRHNTYAVAQRDAGRREGASDPLRPAGVPDARSCPAWLSCPPGRQGGRGVLGVLRREVLAELR